MTLQLVSSPYFCGVRVEHLFSFPCYVFVLPGSVVCLMFPGFFSGLLNIDCPFGVLSCLFRHQIYIDCQKRKGSM
jgi:hypothetical protein